MDIRRFKEIIEYSHCNHKNMELNVKDFYTKINMDYEHELLDVSQIVRPLFQKKKYIVIELPFSDKEIGALCYKGESFGYTLINSSLPKVNVNFALCHEIYHIFYQEKIAKRTVELYMNEHYYDYKDEFAANLFAGMLMMPEQSYKMMFHKFNQDTKDRETEFPIVIKLMNYFKVPYMAALIRCYELDLLSSGETLAELIHSNSTQIRDEFKKLWLDESLLNPTKKDEFELLESIVSLYGTKYIEDELISEHTVKKALQNMRKLYYKIKED